jgi:TM2 domain-containing membrane protein YozV
MLSPITSFNMNDQQRAWFNAEYQHARKEEAIGVLLALFLGGLGIHHFYLRRNGLGILYLVFSWTGIPTILGWIECFFMPGRVRAYNAAQATFIAAQIFAATPQTADAATVCPHCGQPVIASAAYCRFCGAAINGQPEPQPTA